jgi:DNA adenine methylase
MAIAPTKRPNLNLLRIEEELSAAHLRLCRVYIENKPYQEIIKRYDRPNTFFYVDPPYYTFEDYYGPGIFSTNDFSLLAQLLSNIQGKFVMSINDVPVIRDLFKSFHIEEAITSYSAAAAHRKKQVTELLIMNYKPKE